MIQQETSGRHPPKTLHTVQPTIAKDSHVLDAAGPYPNARSDSSARLQYQRYPDARCTRPTGRVRIETRRPTIRINTPDIHQPD